MTNLLVTSTNVEVAIPVGEYQIRAMLPEGFEILESEEDEEPSYLIIDEEGIEIVSVFGDEMWVYNSEDGCVLHVRRMRFGDGQYRYYAQNQEDDPRENEILCDWVASTGDIGEYFWFCIKDFLRASGFDEDSVSVV
jgi:hypothetical protein